VINACDKDGRSAFHYRYRRREEISGVACVHVCMYAAAAASESYSLLLS